MKIALKKAILGYTSLLSIFFNMLSPLAYATLVATPVRAEEGIEITSESALPVESAVPTPESPVVEQTLNIAVLPETEASSVLQADLVIDEDGDATLSTDKTDYSPVDTALITGTGYVALQTYSLSIWSNDEPAVRTTVDVVATEAGEIAYAYQLDGNYRPDYQVEVKNQAGEVVASIHFSDSRWVVAATVNGSSTTTVDPSAVINTEVMVMTWNGILDWNNDWRSTSYQIGSDTAICVNNANHNNTGVHTEGFSITAPVNPGAYNVTFQPYSNDNCTGGTINLPLTLGNAIIVNDIIAPVITLVGTSPLEVERTSTYVDAGATALDNYDGDITGSIVINSNVDANVVGTYSVTYNVADAAGNAAATVTRIVNVVDTTAPAVPTGLGFRNMSNTANYVCDAFLTRQPVIPFWDAYTEDDFAHYEYTSFHPNGSIGLNTQILNTNELVNSWMPPTDGAYGFAVRSVDTTGNRSAWAPVDMTLAGSCKINYDSTSPTKPAFTTPTNNSYTNVNAITLIWTGGDDLGSGVYGYNVRYVFSPANGGPAVNWASGWVATTSKTRSGSFGHGEGRYEIYVQVKDNLDNLSEESLPLVVTYDSTAPVVDILTPTTSLIRGIVDIRGAVEDVNPMRYYMVVKNIGGVVVAGPGTVYESDSFSDRLLFTWNTNTGFADGQYTIHLAARDLADNRTAVSEDNKIVTVDNTLPTTPTVYGFTDPTVACGGYTNQRMTTINWGGSTDANGIAGYGYNVNYPLPGGGRGSWTTFFSSTSYRGSLNEGIHHIKVQAKDNAGNYSAWSNTCDITYDSILPVVTLSEVPVDGLLTNQNYQVFGATTNEPVSACTLNLGDESSYPMSMVEGNNQSWTVSVEGMADGNYDYSVSCTDLAANEGESSTRSIIIDTQAPVLGDTTVFTGWYSEDQTAFFTYEDENGIQEETENPISCVISTEGELQTCSIPEVNICDNAGNCNTESVTSNGANIDKFAPTIALTTSPSAPDANNNWFKTQPELTLTVTDVNPLLAEYQWGGIAGEWTTYVAPFKLSAEGKYMLYFRALDKSGKYSEVGSREIKWDQTGLTKAPFDLAVSPNPTTSDKAVVTWKAAEDAMGIAKYEVHWRLGDTVYTETVGGDVLSREIDRLTEGDWKITVRAFDDAGNNLEANVGLRVDRTAPNAPTLVLGAVGTGTVSLSWNSVEGADDYSIWYGTSTGSYTFGARVGNTTTFTVEGLGAGNYYFAVKAHDAAGNVSGYSNEVNTGTIAGAPGAIPGEPAEGFAPAEDVLGEQTDATPEELAAGSEPETLGETVLGTASSSLWGILKSWWWLWILILAAIYMTYRYLKSRRS